MQWRILSIDPGDNDNDVVVRVGYYYDENTRRRRVESSADFIEEHLISNVPDQRPKTNVLGQYVRSQGEPINPWVEVDGVWVRRSVEEIADEIEWEAPPEEEIQDFLLAPLRGRAEQINGDRPQRGRKDVYPEHARPGRNRGRRRTVGGNILAMLPEVVELIDIGEVI